MILSRSSAAGRLLKIIWQAGSFLGFVIVIDGFEVCQHSLLVLLLGATIEFWNMSRKSRQLLYPHLKLMGNTCVQLCYLCIMRTLTDAYSKSFQVSNLTHISLIKQLEYKLEVIICVQLVPGEGSSTNKHFVGYAIDVNHLAEILIFGLHSKKITFFGNSFFTIHICQELFQTVIAIYTGHLQCSG